MQRLRLAFLMGAAVIAAAELSGPAAAQTITHKSTDTHVLVVRLPDGSLGRIRYAGKLPPQVRFDGPPSSAPGFSDPFWPGSPFADLDRISAAMDREADALLQQADGMMNAVPSSPTRTDIERLPAGLQGYSMVSTMSGNRICTRTLRYFSADDGLPHIRSSTSGDCAAIRTTKAAAPARVPHPAVKPKASDIIEVNAKPTISADGASRADLRLVSAGN